MRKELITLVAGIIAVGEALTPKSAVALSTVVTPVEASLMGEAIDCVLTAKPGKRVLLARDYPGVAGQREVVVLDGKKRNRYTVEITNTYPKPYNRQINEGLTVEVAPYLQIYARPNGTQGQDVAKTYMDGVVDPTTQRQVDVERHPWRKAGLEELQDIDAEKKLDGTVDSAMYPEDKHEIDVTFEAHRSDVIALKLSLEDQFQGKRKEY